jgi:hypothetical protein
MNIKKILLILFFIYLVYLVFNSTNKNLKAFKQELPNTFILPDVYEKIIDTSCLKKIKVVKVHNNKNRNPIAFCSYDNNYSIAIYQISNFNNNLAVEDLINVSFEKIDDDFYGTFSGYKDTIFPYELFVNANQIQQKSNKIYLNLYGDSLQKINDERNIVCYSLNLKGFYIKYFNDDNVDMYLTTYEKSFFKQRYEIYSSILFVKNNENLFFLLMTPRSINTMMPPDLLYNIVVK